MERQANRLQRAKEQEEASKRWFDLKVNTSVYITGLPEDVTEQKLADVRLFGLAGSCQLPLATTTDHMALRGNESQYT